MIDSTNCVIVGIPVNAGLHTHCCEHGEKACLMPQYPVRPVGPAIMPRDPKIILTESGYIVKVPEQKIGGPKVTITKLGLGYYLVTSKATVYGAKTRTEVMTEKELVDKFNGFKFGEKPKDKKTEEKIAKIVEDILKNPPVIYFDA